MKIKMFYSFLALITMIAGISAPKSTAEPSTTATDRKLTSRRWLDNGIPVIIRETPGSDIVHVEVRFRSGTSHLPPEQRAINLVTFSALPFATKSFPKDKVFSLTEKYAIHANCSGGVEMSACEIDVILDYLPEALDLLLSVVTEPAFNKDDVELVKKQRISDFRQELQNPEARVNSIVNTVFYDTNHPYRLLPEEGVKQTELFTAEHFKNYYASILDATNVFVTYAGPKISRRTMNTLESTLGKLKKIQRQGKSVPSPTYNADQAFAFEHRDIPTAYIRSKFNAPAATSPDAPAANVLFEILSEKLHEEVRTKKSLSYSVHASTLQMHQGIGVISASTSKPKETIETISTVVKELRDKKLSPDELREYKNVFTTSYYLTMETHEQLSAALSATQAYLGDASMLYELPSRIDAVTPDDIQRVARDVLKNFRVGIVYDKAKFDEQWVNPLRSIK
jgi:zinc protease